MFHTVVATRFIRRMTNGRTVPCLIECEDENGNKYELVVKFSANMFEKEKNLAIEAIVAMLASDLCLPVAEPFLVELDSAFVDRIAEQNIKDVMQKSCSFAFGSRHVKHYVSWIKNQKIKAEATQMASEILLFDAIIRNADRLPANPNCLFLGNSLFIFDHELALGKLLFWQEPWKENSLKDLADGEKHIFAKPYFEKRPSDFDRFIDAWSVLTDKRLEEYKNTLPANWVVGNEQAIDEMMVYFKQVRSNIRVITENALKELR